MAKRFIFSSCYSCSCSSSFGIAADTTSLKKNCLLLRSMSKSYHVLSQHQYFIYSSSYAAKGGSSSYSTKSNNSSDEAGQVSTSTVSIIHKKARPSSSAAFSSQKYNYSMIAEALSVVTAATSSSSNTLSSSNNETQVSMKASADASHLVETSNNKPSTPVVNLNKAEKSSSSSTNNYFANSSPNHKKSKSSESRERLNHFRYFYADPEIDKASEKPLIRLNPMAMMYMGVSDDNSHLLKSANYLRGELPIRLAHMIKELRNLPFIVACNPSMLEIHERTIKAFRNFDNFDKEIRDLEAEKKFNEIVFEMLEINKDLLAFLCDGFRDTRRYIKNESFIKTNLNKILSARLGIRLLSEHHIALHRQSSLNHLNNQSSSIEDDQTRPSSFSNNDSNNGVGAIKDIHPALGGNSGDNNCLLPSSIPPGKDENWVGIIHKKFSPKALIETSGRMVTRLCVEKYGVAPKIKIDGHTNAQFPYMPLPLEYILPELLKNSFRAICEHQRGSANLPDVNVTIAINEKDCVLRIRDRGGGIPHALTHKIFDYHFTTARNNSNGDDAANMNTTISQSDQHLTGSGSGDKNCCDDAAIFNESGMGMICEINSSKSLGVMHGYGFGLPTSKAYIEYLGGSLTFQSMQGIGSDFYLRMALLDTEPETVRI